MPAVRLRPATQISRLEGAEAGLRVAAPVPEVAEEPPGGLTPLASAGDTVAARREGQQIRRLRVPADEIGEGHAEDFPVACRRHRLRAGAGDVRAVGEAARGRRRDGDVSVARFHAA